MQALSILGSCRAILAEQGVAMEGDDPDWPADVSQLEKLHEVA